MQMKWGTTPIPLSLITLSRIMVNLKAYNLKGNILIGAVAQLGERVNGIHEVRGSTPLGSTNIIK